MSNVMKIKNGFLKKTSIYFIGTLATKMISILLVPIYAYFVAVNELSEYDYLITIASTISPIVFASIWEAVLKYGIKSKMDKAALFSTVLSFVFFMTLLTLTFIPVISVIKGYSEGILFTALFIIVQGITMIWQYSARALQENKRYVIGSVVGSVALIVIDLVLVVLGKLNFAGLSISYLISQVLIACVLEAKIQLISLFSPAKISKRILKKLLFFSLPLVVNNVSLWLYSSGSRIIIKNMIGVMENGLYAFASKFSLIISLISMVVSMAVIEEAYSYNTIEEYKNKMSSLISIISKAYFGIIALAIPALYILYNIAFRQTGYYDSVDYIFLLLLGALFTALSNNFGSAFQVTDNTKYIFLTTLAGAGVALALSLILNKFFGIYGVLIGNAVGQFVMMLIRVIYAKRTTGLTINWFGNIRIFVISCIEYAALLVLDNVVAQILIFVLSMIYLSFEYRKELVLIERRILHKEQ